MTTLAYSYIRWSSPKQATGDSLRRQTKATRAWCKRNKVTLDEKLTLLDAGKSAFTGEHRKNPDRHALAMFLQMVNDGKIPRGSYLVIENLDRLSREHITPALTLLLNLLAGGIRVVQLKPVELVFEDRAQPMQLMMAVMELSRGHSESKMKSDRVGEAWENRRDETRNKGVVLTRRLPAWVRIAKDGKMKLIPEKAQAVKRIFDLAAAGYGTRAIVRKLTTEGVKPIGRSPRWGPAYVWSILNDRRAVGDLQPMKNHKPDGDPIPNYFPAIVSEDEWASAKAEAGRRMKRPGRRSYFGTNVFNGLTKNARDGESYVAMTRTSHGRQSRVLVALSGIHGRSNQFGFP